MRTKRLLVSAAVLLGWGAVSWVAACGSGGDTTAPGEDAGHGTTTDATAGDGGRDAAPSVDANAALDAASSDASDAGGGDSASPYDAASAAFVGDISVTWGYGGPGGPAGHLGVGFHDAPYPPDAGCTTQAVGASCTFSTCPLPGSGGDGPPVSFADSGAGTVDVVLPGEGDSGAYGDGGVVVFQPTDAGPRGMYVATSGFSSPFVTQFIPAAGETIHATGTGDTAGLGPFAIGGALPGRLDVTSPPVMIQQIGHEGGPSRGVTSFPRSQDLVIAFSGGVAGTQVRADLAVNTSTNALDLQCFGDQGLGMMTIPTSALQMLPEASDAGGGSGALTVAGWNQVIVPDGPAAIIETLFTLPATDIYYANTD